MSEYIVHALQNRRQKIMGEEGPVPLNWMPFVVCSADFASEVSGFRRYRIRALELSRMVDATSEESPLKSFLSSFRGENLASSAALPEVFSLFVAESIEAWFDLWKSRSCPPFLDALEAWNRSELGRIFWTCRYRIDMRRRQIMAIWNVTPDSFSSHCEHDGAASLAHGKRLCDEGADVLDIGAESTRPGAQEVSPETERLRLEAPLEWAKTQGIPISVDTRHLSTMEWGLSHGLWDIVNDVALSSEVTQARDGAVFSCVRDYGAGYIAMAYECHEAPVYALDVCARRIVLQLGKRLDMAWASGCDMRQISVDPGIGFGKGLENDLRLITYAPRFLSIFGRPIWIAHSRKRCLAKATGKPLESLDEVTAIASGLSFASGADGVRVHSPRHTRCALVLSNSLWERK